MILHPWCSPSPFAAAVVDCLRPIYIDTWCSPQTSRERARFWASNTPRANPTCYFTTICCMEWTSYSMTDGSSTPYPIWHPDAQHRQLSFSRHVFHCTSRSTNFRSSPCPLEVYHTTVSTGIPIGRLLTCFQLQVVGSYLPFSSRLTIGQPGFREEAHHTAWLKSWVGIFADYPPKPLLTNRPLQGSPSDERRRASSCKWLGVTYLFHHG